MQMVLLEFLDELTSLSCALYTRNISEPHEFIIARYFYSAAGVWDTFDVNVEMKSKHRFDFSWFIHITAQMSLTQPIETSTSTGKRISRPR